ncbi:MAG: nuclear transport factor 2 family protein [Pseudolabrys sp.]|nr:nuclear transport factor 2 family protein [Pseudolabrys sp.]
MTNTDRSSAPPASPGPDRSAPARAVVMAIQDAFAKADYARMAALYDDEIDWLFHGPVSIFPEIGHRHGKVAVFRAFEALNTLYRFDRYVMDQLVAEADWAAGIADVTMTQRASGRTIQCRIASFHRVRDGRLIHYRGFNDSFDAVEQVLGRIITP